MVSVPGGPPAKVSSVVNPTFIAPFPKRKFSNSSFNEILILSIQQF